MSTASREPLTACLTDVLAYWGATDADAPIGLARFDCCCAYVCLCAVTDGTTTTEPTQAQAQP